jgi:glycosyltransferase involved in cell wall biosynthesis
VAKILYLTQDGITDHIGQAQIAPYILGLAALGHEIHILSPEKPGREALKEKYRGIFDAAGVRWSTVRYANRPPLVSSFTTLWLMYRKAEEITRAERPDLVHSRSFLPWEIVIRLKRKFGVKALLDFRDFWVDLRLETAPFKFVYRLLKRREPTYFNAADHIVTLTSRAVDILMSWYPQAVGGRRDRYTVIPCCADFTHFDPERTDRRAVEAHRKELGLGEGPILLYLGSLGADYLLPQMLRLFQVLREMRPTAQFLFLSNNAAEQVEAARIAAGIPDGAIRFISVDRTLVPEYISLADLSVVFVRPSLSKAGGSPTKLAEVFALNVPVIANSGVGDMDAIIDYERNGSTIVKDFEPETLRAALEKALALPTERRMQIRANSVEYTLEEGVRRYARIYDELAPASPRSKAA